MASIDLGELLKKTAKNKEAIRFFKDLFESMHLIITDMPNMDFTISSDGKQIKVAKGLHGTPTLTVPVETERIMMLWRDFKDGNPDKAARQRIAQALFVPAIQSIYDNPDFKTVVIGNLSHLDEFIHFSLVTDEGEEFAKTTVINKYDQWIVIPGFWGDAPLKAEMSIDQALKAYSLIVKISKAGFREKMKLMQEFRNLVLTTRKKYEIQV